MEKILKKGGTHMEPMKTVTIKGQQFEIVDGQARNNITQAQQAIQTAQGDITTLQEDTAQIEDDLENLQVRNLYGMQDGRAITANIPPTGSNSMQYLLATSTMAEGKPPIGDAKILHMEWDNTGGWTSQLAIGHPKTMNAATALAIRRMSSGTWGDWMTLLDLLYPVGSVYISNTNTNPAGTLGGGTWELIHQRFAYKIIEDPITFNTTNTQSGDSVAMINGEQIELRLSFAPKVDLTDSTIEIGQLNLAQIGLTGKYAEYVPFFADGGNGIAYLQVTNAGVIQTQDVLTKASGGTIPASTSTGQARVSLMFGQGSMMDSFCDEFHWKRTA